MASFRPRKRTIGGDIDRDDIISRLPGEIKDKILTELPIKDAVRTSILSTNWRYSWASIPNLVVKDDDLVPTVNEDTMLESFHLVKNVDILLLNHHGPVLKFGLSTKYYCHEAFDRWILNLSRNGITEFTFLLNLASTFKYRIPSNFFFCDGLQYVDLSSCLVKLPRGFEEFLFLKTLKLEKCTISAADLEWLVSRSPNLVEVVLEDVYVGDKLRICSKGLTYLTVWGVFPDIQIDAPNLTDLMIGCLNYTNSISSERLKRGINYFFQGLGGLFNIRNIGFFCCSKPYLVHRSPAVLLNSCFQILSVVVLGVDLADQKESSFALSLLQIAANFRYLSICVRRSGNTTTSSLWDKDIVFKSLRMVSIARFIASEPDLAFVKFILKSSPNLRRLTLMEDPKGPKEENPEIYQRLLELQRASTRAEIIFK